MTTILLVLILILVLAIPDRNYKDQLNKLESKLESIERIIVKKEAQHHKKCPKCGGEGYMYMNKHQGSAEGLHFVEDTNNLGNGYAYRVECNGHGELTYEGKVIQPAEWEN